MTDLSDGREQMQSLERNLERSDSDPQETAEWMEALDAVVACVGRDRAQYLVDRLAEHAFSLGIESSRTRITPYANTIRLDQQAPYPGNLELEERLAAALRWNWVAILRAMRRRQTSSKSASTISFEPAPPMAPRAAATWSTFKRIRRRGFMHVPSSKDS